MSRKTPPKTQFVRLSTPTARAQAEPGAADQPVPRAARPKRPGATTLPHELDRRQDLGQQPFSRHRVAADSTIIRRTRSRRTMWGVIGVLLLLGGLLGGLAWLLMR